MLSFYRNLPNALFGFVEKRPILCVFVVVIYVLSPFDLFPEFIVGPLGVFDDALVTIAALSLLKRVSRKKSLQKSAKESPPPKQIPQQQERRKENRFRGPKDRDRRHHGRHH